MNKILWIEGEFGISSKVYKQIISSHKSSYVFTHTTTLKSALDEIVSQEFDLIITGLGILDGLYANEKQYSGIIAEIAAEIKRNTREDEYGFKIIDFLGHQRSKNQKTPVIIFSRRTERRETQNRMTHIKSTNQIALVHKEDGKPFGQDHVSAVLNAINEILKIELKL